MSDKKVMQQDKFKKLAQFMKENFEDYGQVGYVMIIVPRQEGFVPQMMSTFDAENTNKVLEYGINNMGNDLFQNNLNEN